MIVLSVPIINEKNKKQLCKPLKIILSMSYQCTEKISIYIDLSGICKATSTYMLSVGHPILKETSK